LINIEINITRNKGDIAKMGREQRVKNQIYKKFKKSQKKAKS